MISEQAIGIFDSGVGGLTVAHAVTQLLPNEDIIYFGDTAHLPYGDKSTAAIQAYTIKICDCLLKQKCKIILIACNSASTAAFELVKEYVGPKAKVLDVIDPVVEYIGQNYENSKIGLIGTKQTVFSNVYKKKIDELDRGIVLQSLATPLLVPMIEEDFCHNKIIDSLIHSYLQDPVLSDIEALVLACTHYPLIKDQLMLFYKDKVKIIDSSGLTAQALKKILECENIKNMKKTTGKMHFYVSDYTDSFSRSAAIFFQNKLVLEHYPL
ncbi:MAG: hypothetical protein ACD_44C00066G0007 [uncultured bacterium]|nr:MAG: hypothetical protein ACD_44C00066G0007 [uncultured bacterium]OGT16816.1 MAG: glutamate racemase [Gammaproteobacteria bacterium RIFCSPHIGHO2_02_FULL_38_33]OGT24780.1 MAG: glutamate racemase [Gammaproteobacteria bacterium RIFCSPHIGHO2_12_38_15]OGT76177.1 MAG: glutamate racemase [Gammaproteobacteria bacterium RIFCSPLOWO2_12_FULL_38_14]